MQLPIVAPAPIVSAHATAFWHLFNDVRQFEHFQNYLTGLIVLENKSLANISRCILESADKTNLSRFLNASPWQPQEVNQFRIQYVLAQTVAIRPAAKAGYLILDDTLCEHVGSLFEYVERHYDHCDGTPCPSGAASEGSIGGDYIRRMVLVIVATRFFGLVKGGIRILQQGATV